MANRSKATYALWVLFGINMMNFFDRQILAAVTEPIRMEWHLNDSALGWLNTAFVLLYAAVGVPLIACGGAGSVAHLREVLEHTPANAAALGSMAVYQKKGMGVLINFPRRQLVIGED